MNNNSRSNGDMFIIGALIGGMAALLFAPDKGRNTRDKMMQTVKHFRDNTSEKVNSAKNAAKNGLDETREKTADVAQNVADRLSEKSSEIKKGRPSDSSDDYDYLNS